MAIRMETVLLGSDDNRVMRWLPLEIALIVLFRVFRITIIFGVRLVHVCIVL